MATKKFRCFKECFAYNKRFKKGEFFPVLWLDSGYVPQPEYFIAAEDYEDFMRTQVKASRTIYSAADDPRTTAMLVEGLSKFMGDIPKDWNRKRIWAALKQRENAEVRTEKRGPGRPAKEA